MVTIDELAASNEFFRILLLGPTSHAEVARHMNVNESAVRKWRKRHREERQFIHDIPHVTVPAAEQPEEHVTFSTADRTALHAKLDDLLDQANTDPSGVRSMRVAAWDGMVKGDNGQPVTVKQYGVRLESARWAPSWPVVQEAPPITFVLHQGYQPPAPEERVGPWRIALILPDLQAGFYRDTAGKLHPTHDEAAIDVALQICQRLKPHEILIGGDGLDLPEVGRYRLSPVFAQTTQATVNWAGQFVATLRKIAPRADINWLAGNHEERLPNYLMDNARAAFGLHQASDTEGWPVLSVPHLCRFDEYEIKYIPGYPASEYWFNDRIRAVHGDRVNSNGSTVHRYLNSERASTISFHIHRREWGERTRQTRSGARTILAASPGCLCRIDGAVPSVKGGVDLDGVPLQRAEDWQLGVGVLRFAPGDGPFVYEQIAIHKEDEGTWAMFQGSEIYGHASVTI